MTDLPLTTPAPSQSRDLSLDEILIHKVNDFGGTVNELTADGIMALFGAPIALEDAPQRAIRSSLAIHGEITRLSMRMTRDMMAC